MKNYLKEYVVQIHNLLNTRVVNIDYELENHLIKIKFFQHERLIHLLVTLMYALLALLSFMAAILTPMFVFVGIILVFFLIPYVLHYFFLENNVQYLYKQYDQMLKIKEENRWKKYYF